jgi:lysophospholipase L1-like esterase
MKKARFLASVPPTIGWLLTITMAAAVNASDAALAPTLPDAPATVLPVDSTAFVFSPGNWVGDAGRAGKLYRQTWNPGAYVRITWETKAARTTPTLLLDTSPYPAKFKPPILVCNLDGLWSTSLPCAAAVPVPGLQGAGRHCLTVYLKQSEQHDRWGTPGSSGGNVVRLTGIQVDADSQPGTAPPAPRWTLIIGDSITEGCGAYELEGYSHLIGQAFRALGFEYAVSACGWSGWLHRGDNPPGDVPGYYTITNSINGAGGQYIDADSRWNKIDANHSLLDAQYHFSAYGETGQEPSAIVINYGTNDAIHKTNPSDVQASMAQCLSALRAAAPRAHLFIIIPFGQYKAAELKQAVDTYQATHPNDRQVSLIDLGPDAARALAANSFWGGLHPNARAHATFAAEIIAQMTATLFHSGKINR